MQLSLLESEREILDAVRAADGQITRGQLKGLSRIRAIGAGQQSHKKGAPGSQTDYPAGTTLRVLEIGRLCGWGKKRLRGVSWKLWWNRREGDVTLWKRHFVETAKWYDAEIRKLAKAVYPRGSADISDWGFAAFEKLRDKRTHNPNFRQFRKRVAAKNWDTAMRFAVEIATGQFSTWDQSEIAHDTRALETEKSILDIMLGVSRARRDRLSNRDPWLTGDIDEPLAALAKTLKTEKLVTVLQRASDAELKLARDELQDVCEIVSCASPPLEYVFGKHAFGFTVLAQIARNPDPRLQALLVLMWLVLKQAPNTQNDIDELLSALPIARQLSNDYARLRQVGNDNQVLAPILMPRRGTIRFTYQSPRGRTCPQLRTSPLHPVKRPSSF